MKKVNKNIKIENHKVYSGKRDIDFKALLIRDYSLEPLTFKEKKKRIIKQLECSKHSVAVGLIKKVKSAINEEAILNATSLLPQNEWNSVYNIIISPVLKDDKKNVGYVSIVTVPMKS